MLPIQKRVISLLLAFLLGFTSVGYSIDLHFCQGHLKSVALIGKAKSCHEMAAKSSCHKHKEDIQESSCSGEEDERGCCNNEQVSDNFDYDVVFDANILEDDSIQQPFKPVLNENQIVSNEIMSDSAKNYKNPDPPNSHGQLIRVVHCSFLC